MRSVNSDVSPTRSVLILIYHCQKMLLLVRKLLLDLFLLLLVSVKPSHENLVAIFSETGHSTSIRPEAAGAGDGGSSWNDRRIV